MTSLSAVRVDQAQASSLESSTRDRRGRVQAEQASIHLGEGARRFEAVQPSSFTIESGEFVCVLGPSGCGKSTLLGALAGHLPISHGRLLVDGQPVGAPSPDRGMVFQHHTLLPWNKVVDNVGFGLKMRGVSTAERREAASAMLAQVGLIGYENHWPSQLSGGQQQRVEIARVLINRPRLLLMDEPFGALDAQCRMDMQQLLLDIWTRIRTTVVFVTHDIDEALFLADRVLVMSPRPGHFIEDLHITFPRPRHTELVTSEAFMHLKRHCLELLRHKPEDLLPRLSPLGIP